jgi:hypothetical protein
MPPDLIAQFGPRLVVAVTVALVFAYLWATHRERYLLIWSGAWTIWTLRYAYGLAGNQLALPSEVVLPVLALVAATLTLAGAFALTRERLPRTWLVIVLLDAAWLVVEQVTGDPLVAGGVAGPTHWLLLASGLIWAGATFLLSRAATGFERTIAGIGLIVLGVIQVISPWSPGWLDSLGALLSMSAQLAIALGTIMAYFRRAHDDSLALQRRLEDALTTVLGGIIPICAHCKSIRDESGRWERLESYITTHTDAELSHGICDVCMAKHYPDYR